MKYIIARTFKFRWEYWLEDEQVLGVPIWTGLRNNAKTFTLEQVEPIIQKLRKEYPDDNVRFELAKKTTSENY
jgi:hypothetical protein